MFKSPCSLPGRRALIVTAMSMAFTWPVVGSAQSYPNGAITMVVPFSPGAGTDIVARAISEKLTGLVGVPVIVENRPGAAGVIGTTQVANARPDGQTLLFTPNSIAFAHRVSGGGRVPYDPVESFTPVIEVCQTPVYLAASPKAGVKSFAELQEAAKLKQPTYGSAGMGSITHLIGEAVNQTTGINLTHVPYKGTAPAVADLLGGHVDYAYASLSTIEPYIESQRVHVLATTGNTRTELAPSVPALAELGYESMNLGSWYGVFAPKGTSEAVVDQLNEHFNTILKMPDIVEIMKKQGSIPTGGPANVMDATNKADVATFEKLIAELDLAQK